MKEVVPNLQRPRKRIVELMLKSLSEQKTTTQSSKTFMPIFYRSPVNITEKNKHAVSVEYNVNILENEQAKATGQTEIIPTDLICRSIGYKSIKVDPSINFNINKGRVNNEGGRVLLKGNHTEKYDVGLYTSGWLATGPTGVILTTMNNSFTVADRICKDFDENLIDSTEQKSGIENTVKRLDCVTWSQWKKIDEYELENGKKLNKLREKIIDIRKMLEVAK